MNITVLGHKHKVDKLVLALLALGFSTGAAAWVDERTPQAQPQDNQAQVVSSANEVSPQQWDGVYPGPFGKMKLADALIAITVPMTQAPITFDASDEDLALDVDLQAKPNITRKDVLRSLTSQTHRRLRFEDDVFYVINESGTSSKSTKTNNAGAPEPSIQMQETVIGSAATAPEAAVAPAGVQDLTSQSFAEQVASATPLPAPEMAQKHWHLAEGAMLSSAMLDWTKKWGWSLVWNADVDYRISANIDINDSFLGAVDKVLKAYSRAPRPLMGNWQREQKVLVICEPGTKNCNAQQ